MHFEVRRKFAQETLDSCANLRAHLLLNQPHIIGNLDLPPGRYDDFVSASKAAMVMRRQNPSLRVRRDVETVGRAATKAARSKRRHR